MDLSDTTYSGQRIALVVEDEADLRECVTDCLEDGGYTVLNAPDGASALSLARWRHPNVILLDMRMPVMDGWKFCRQYRRLPAPHAPIIVMTAAVDAHKRAQEVDADAALPKPFTDEELLTCVGRLAQRPAIQEDDSTGNDGAAIAELSLLQAGRRLELLLGRRATLVQRQEYLRQRRALLVRELSSPPPPSSEERAARLAALNATSEEEAQILAVLSTLCREHQELLTRIDQLLQNAT